MDLNYQQHLPEDFSDNSKVWVYQSSRIFSMSEAFQIEDLLTDFIANWESHGSLIKGYANLFFGQFIVLMADDSSARLCGSSADKSIRLMKDIEGLLKVDLLNRQSLAFLKDDKVQILPLSQLSYALENNFVEPETIYFNNLVSTKKMLMSEWLVPIKDSWLKTKIKTAVNG